MRSPVLSQTTARRKSTSSYPKWSARAERAKTGTNQEYLIETQMTTFPLHTHTHTHTHTFSSTSTQKQKIIDFVRVMF